jgi:5-methylcytosine-specific restriction enzyme subunit McrC
MFGEFEIVRDYCQLFLTNCISFDYKNDLKLFAFLLPMDYVFEDFIFGFIHKELKNVTAKPQKTDTYLDEGKAFNMQPDLWLETDLKSLIADTKYKIIYSDKKDPKKGISHSDLYQMLAYAVRFDVDEIILFYPSTIKQIQEVEVELRIKDALADGKEISIRVFQLPIINRALFETNMVIKTDLKELFEPTRQELLNRIEKILF